MYISKERHRGGYRWRVVAVVDGARAAQTFADEGEARAVFRELKRQARDRAALDVGELVDLWLDDMGRRCKERTVSQHRALMEGLLDLSLAIDEVTPDRARELYRAYQDGRAVASHQQALGRVKALWRWAIDEGHATRNPWRKVQPEGIRSRRKKQLRADEARAFLGVCLADGNSPHRAVACLMPLLLGMRPGEVLALAPRDVDDDGRLVWIADGKTVNAARVLEVPDLLRDRLAAVAAAAAGGDRLFARSEGWLNKSTAIYCERAGVPRVSPHGLRGTHATLARSAGATSRLVADTLGHGATAVTDRHYIAPGTGEQADAQRTLRVLVGGKR